VSSLAQRSEEEGRAIEKQDLTLTTKVTFEARHSGTCHHFRTQEAEQEGCEFKASLGYIARSNLKHTHTSLSPWPQAIILTRKSNMTL
jgi:hypothetical protein